VLDKYGSLRKADVALGAQSTVLKMLVMSVSCCSVAVEVFSPDLNEFAQGIAERLYDEGQKKKETHNAVKASALEQELEIKTA
jgi:hypothetical protein